MNKRVRENLSAYLDGEVNDPSAVARLIAASPEAAKEHSAYAELSARIRSLNEPEIHPAFATRVVAAVEEQRATRRIGWRLPLGLSAAALALLVGIVSVRSAQPSTPNVPAVTAMVPAPAAPAPAAKEDAMLAELERRVSQDSQLHRFFKARFDNAQPADLYTERLIAAVAGSRSGAAAGEAFAHGVDYRAAVQRLDDSQADALKKLLAASMREALAGVIRLRLFTTIAAGVCMAGASLFAPAQTHSPSDAAAFKPLTYPIDAAAFDKNLSQKEREIYQLIEDLIAVRSKRTLGCDDATMKALAGKTSAIGKQLTMLKWQRSGLREHLRWCLEFGKTESGVKENLELLLTYEGQIADVLAQMVHESQPVLGVAKSAQFYLFVDDFERYLATRVAEASKGAPPQPAVESATSTKTAAKHAPDDFDAFQKMLREKNPDVPLNGLGGADVVKLVDALLVVRLAQALDINKEDTVKLFAHIGKAKDQLHELKWQIGHNRFMLREAIAAKAPDAEIQKQLDDLLIQEKAVASLVREFVEGAGKDVTVAQSAKLYLFLGDFEAYIVSLLERAQT